MQASLQVADHPYEHKSRLSPEQYFPVLPNLPIRFHGSSLIHIRLWCTLFLGQKLTKAKIGI